MHNTTECFDLRSLVVDNASNPQCKEGLGDWQLGWEDDWQKAWVGGGLEWQKAWVGG